MCGYVTKISTYNLKGTLFPPYIPYFIPFLSWIILSTSDAKRRGKGMRKWVGGEGKMGNEKGEKGQDGNENGRRKYSGLFHRVESRVRVRVIGRVT